MAISDSYASVPEYRASVGKTDSGDDLTISRHLLACTRFYESQTHQFYNRDEEAVDRIFFGNGSACLKVYGGDNCPGIASSAGMVVKIDSGLDGTYATTLTALQYLLDPPNALLGPEPKPYKEIVLPSWTTASYRSWPAGGRVNVTAKFGWPSVPEMVKADVIELCGIWRAENPRSTGRMNELDQVVTASPMAMSLVKKFQQANYEPVFA